MVKASKTREIRETATAKKSKERRRPTVTWCRGQGPGPERDTRKSEGTLDPPRGCEQLHVHSGCVADGNK